MEEHKGLGIEKFEGREYRFWRKHTKDLLSVMDLHLILDESKLKGMHEDDWKFLD